MSCLPSPLFVAKKMGKELGGELNIAVNVVEEINDKASQLIFPHQLFKESPLFSNKAPVYLVEEFLFFKQYPFHKQKIAFHRASMKTV